jgi:hypothetical protein
MQSSYKESPVNRFETEQTMFSVLHVDFDIGPVRVATRAWFRKQVQCVEQPGTFFNRPKLIPRMGVNEPLEINP